MDKPPAVSDLRQGSAATDRATRRFDGRTAQRPLLAPIEVPDAEILREQLPAPTARLSYVAIDRAAIEGKGSPFWQAPGVGRFQVPLPEGGNLTVVIDDSTMLGANRFTSVGRVEGMPESRVVFAYNRGFLTGTVKTADRAFALRPATEQASQWYEIDPSRVPPCGGMVQPILDPGLLSEAAMRRSRELEAAASDGAATAASATGNPGEVHVMMLYTPAVKPSLSGPARTDAMQSEFDAAIADVNSSLEASKVAARLKLVRVAETAYDETVSASDKVQVQALSALQATADGKMDEIHALRDAAGADLVCLALQRNDTTSIGLGYIMSRPSSTNPGYALHNASYAFAVVQYAMISGTEVVAHELGHTFGCAHARGDGGETGDQGAAFPFSYGYRFLGDDGRQYRDIMAYAPGSRLSFYSNPEVNAPSPINKPLGVPAGQPGESNCAMTIERNAFEVSAYRLQALMQPTGTLVNVSTRAFVGTDEKALIGGFVIGGTQPKQVLIRAAGPGLRVLGVSDALANPMLEIYSGSTSIALNDDWGLQSADGASAGDVGGAFGRVGAFPFATGSADSAMLLTLPPGPGNTPAGYTAIVRGAGNATGSALVEVYDLEKAGNKLVNLSTRGYADIDKPMIGGFVVHGAPGTVKRILIRVRGPSLGRDYQLTNAMYDPMFGLYDGQGALLLSVDDWSTGTVSGTISESDDFSPLVKTYSEEQITATTYAPSNRREPCVMLDLAPGSYTVIVQPFERLTGTNPQVAKPGIAVVEVFEIAP